MNVYSFRVNGSLNEGDISFLKYKCLSTYNSTKDIYTVGYDISFGDDKPFYANIYIDMEYIKRIGDDANSGDAIYLMIYNRIKPFVRDYIISELISDVL